MAPAVLRAPNLKRIHSIALPIETVSASDLMRLGPASYSNQVFFGRNASYRFDAPDKSYGVMYAGLDLSTCVAEVLLRDEVLETPTIYESDLARYVVARFLRTPQDFRLAKLYGAMPGLGIDGQISTHPDYAITQAWSKAIHDHPDQVDGLIFLSRLNSGGRNVALFERARGTLNEASRADLVTHPDLAAAIAIPGLLVLP